MSDMLSQDEINALLGGAAADGGGSSATGSDGRLVLTSAQKDTLGEVGNISMGTAATTLSSLLNQKVVITTPTVDVKNWQEIAGEYDRPCVGVKIDYTIGIKGGNLLILKNNDVKIITDLMMGGDGSVGEDIELTEIDLSAIGEAMNQMIGSASTSLSSLIDEKIDIAPPKAFEINFEDADFFSNIGFQEEPFVVVTTFRMQIGNLIDSRMMQILPNEFALQMSNKLTPDTMSSSSGSDDSSQAQSPANNPQQSTVTNNMQQQAPGMQPGQMYGGDPSGMPQHPGMAPGMPPYPGMAPGMPPYPGMAPGMPPYPGMAPGMPPYPGQYPPDNIAQPIQGNVNANPAQFQNFDVAAVKQQKENIGILMDVPLEVTVELGKTSKRIREILEFSPGTIIELDKLAGEPIDILVNGKYIAKGEVVVIDENFAIRVTTIINPEFRI